MQKDLNGQRILVIGGSKYLGKAIAQAASEQGAHVIIGARDEEHGRAVMNHIRVVRHGVRRP